MADNNISNAINTYSDENIAPGMLSSSQIAYCVDKFKLIKNYNEACLGPATYHMRIGNEVLTWDNGKKIEFTLGPEEDKNKNISKSIEFKPNSLTFVTTIEEFNLPKDIIARYNLKSKWVHQGLLLGTGPIVDPELQARLLIPVHNFSSHPVRIDHNDEFISVEFTKTSNPDQQLILENKKPAKYKNNENWNFDFNKYRQRIGNKQVESSVLSQFQSYDKAITFYKETTEKIIKDNEKAINDLKDEYNETIRRYTRYNFIGIMGTIIGIVVLVITTWQLIDSAHNKIELANETLRQAVDKQSKIDDLEKMVHFLTSDFEKMKNPPTPSKPKK